MMTSCPWCKNPASEADWTPSFCRPHTADYEGTTVAELDRQDREEALDRL